MSGAPAMKAQTGERKQWPMVPLGDVCEINPKVKKDEFEQMPENLSFLAMADVAENGSYSPATRSKISVQKGFTPFRENDVILAKITPCFENGKAAHLQSLPTSSGYGSTEFHVLRATHEVHSRYIFHAVWNERFRQITKHRMTGSAGQKRVPATFLKEFEIPLPPLAEQRRIAGILDKLEDIRRKQQSQLAAADRYLRALFLTLFGDPVTNPKGWKQTALGKQCSVVNYGTSNKCQANQVGGSIPILRIPNIVGGEVIFNDLKYCNLSEKEKNTLTLQHGDVLFVRTNGNPEYIARCAVFNCPVPRDQKFAFASYLIRMRLRKDSQLLPPFVQACVSMPSYRNRLLTLARTTAGNYNISGTSLKDLSIPLPPLAEQRRFATAARAVTALKNKLQHQLTQTQTLQRTLSSRAFNGEL